MRDVLLGQCHSRRHPSVGEGGESLLGGLGGGGELVDGGGGGGLAVVEA